MSAPLDTLPRVYRRKPVGDRFRDSVDDRFSKDCGVQWLARASAEYLDSRGTNRVVLAETCMHQAAQLLELSESHDEWHKWWSVFCAWARRVGVDQKREARSRFRCCAHHNGGAA